MCDSNGQCGSCSGAMSIPGGGKILTHNVRTKGFGILYSFEDLPTFAYTAGIEESLGCPELIVFGLDYDLSTMMIDEAVGLIKEGADLSKDEGRYVIGGLKVGFLPVSADVQGRYLQETAAYYCGKQFRVLQMIWADEQGRFPFDQGCSDRVKQSQPVLTQQR